ncbi:MAG: DUF4430 domain-containing protein [Candidatus Saccharibacteria bacterium]
MKRFLACLCLILIFGLTGFVPQVSASYDREKALDYLAAHSGNPWVVMAQAANGVAADTAALKSVEGSSAIDYASPILALTAAGKDPRTYGSSDYVEKLLSFRSGGQIGDPALINDDIFALLALSSAGLGPENSDIVSEKQFILSKTQADGGWGYAYGSGSDSNTTAAAILALYSSGVAKSDPVITGAVGYLADSQNEDGGFAYQMGSPWGSASDSSSTAWVIWVANALCLDEGTFSKQNGPVGFLESMQTEGGYFRYQSGTPEDSFSPVTTSYAAIALSGKYLPVATVSAPDGLYTFRIEGAASSVCSGSVRAATALEVVVNAAEKCGYSYQVVDASFGKYVRSIGSDEAAGTSGWMYLVNYNSPSVGAADYVLSGQDDVVWYFGRFDLIPLRVKLDASQAASGPVSALVETYRDGAWVPAADATVIAGSLRFAADGQGKAVLNLPEGYYQVWAEKEGTIRSGKEALTVGSSAGGSSSVDLSAQIAAGQVDGVAVGIIASPSALDFGVLHPGETRSRTVSIENIGDVSERVTAEVSGDDIYSRYLTIAGSDWRTFSLSLAKADKTDRALKLAVPSGYSGSMGNKTGRIVFWAANE